jgi:hypothetical protein
MLKATKISHGEVFFDNFLKTWDIHPILLHIVFLLGAVTLSPEHADIVNQSLH